MPTYMQESREILLTKVELGLSVEYQQNDPNIASAQIPDIYIVPAFHFTNDANDELWVSAVSNDYVQATVEQPAVADGDYGVEPRKIGPPDGINSPGSPPIAGSDVPPVEPAHLTTTLAPPTTTVR